MKTRLLALILLSAVALNGADPTISSWKSTPRTPGGMTQFVCEVDQYGRIVKAEVYNHSFRQMIEALAVLTKERVVIEACPEEVVSLGFRDQSFEEAMHRLLKNRGYDIVKKDGGIFHIIKRDEAESLK